MRIVRFIVVLALLAGASLYRSGSANAEVSQDVRQACTPDAMRLCSEFVPDVAKITACMKAKHAQLSSTCLTAMRGGMHEDRRARHVIRVEHHEIRHDRRVIRAERHEIRHERHHYRTHRGCDSNSHMCN